MLGLEGRTHYVDPNTLRFHKSRILSAHNICNGLLFYVIESCALDMHGTKRGFRGVVFDLYGNILTRSKLEDCLSTRKAAERVMWKEIDLIDPVAANLDAWKRAREYADREFNEDEQRILKAAGQKVAA